MNRPTLAALSLAVLAAGASAQTATLARDIAAQEVTEYPAASYYLTPTGQSLFFLHVDSTGVDAWGSDGTVTGTRPLGDVCQETCSYEDAPVLATLRGRVVWQEGRGLWSTDGTPAGTVSLTDPDHYLPGDSGSDRGVRLGDRFYFPLCRNVDTFDTECALWSTDGTRAGTGPALADDPDPELIYVSDLVAGRDRVYFFRAGDSRPRELWAADAQGARRFLDLPDSFSYLWTAWENRLFFVVGGDEGAELWASDGTPAGTRAVGSFAGGLVAWLSTGPGGLYFIADDIVHGQEIWRSDGTPEGTRRITEFGTFAPFYLFDYDKGQEGWAFEIDGRLLFAADDQLTGRRLWMTSGTPESTRPVSPAMLGSRLYRAGNRLFAFRYDPQEKDCEFWSFDSQGSATRLVDRLSKEVCGPGTYWANVRVQAVGGKVYFSAQDLRSTWGVWRSDGTPQGTVRLVSSPVYVGEVAVTEGERSVYYAAGDGLWVWDARNGPRELVGRGLRNASSYPQSLTAHQGGLVFNASDGTTDYYTRSIWSSRGSEADTTRFADLASTGCTWPQRFVSAGSALLFVCDVYAAADELRVADPAAGGSTVLARDLANGMVPIEHHGRVWFAGGDGDVWTTDGTVGGTVRLTDAGGNPLLAFYYPDSTNPVPFAISDGRFVYFKASLPNGDAWLWRSDGTPAGTVALAKVTNPYPHLELASTASRTLVLSDGALWRTDGSAPGTERPTDSNGAPLFQYAHHLTANAGAFYAYGERNGSSQTLWRTDGTEAGTVALLPGFEWRTYTEYFPLPRPVGLGGRLIFVASDPQHGEELWTTDGTPVGTSRLADISPGPASSAPTWLVTAGGAVWFTAQDPKHGRELWRTDGTAAGTRLVQDIAPEGRSSAPEQLTAVGDRLYFSADDGDHGRELWSLPMTGAGGCQPSDTALCLQGGRFRVEARWRDFQNHGGVGRAVPLTSDTGTFWFFSPSNTEVLLKVLDGRGVNEHFWVFYGALSNVEYSLTVTDTETGLSRRYSNPAGQLASAGDTQGFGPRGAQSTVPDVVTTVPSPPALVHGWSSSLAAEPCSPNAQRLCLNGGRFAVEVSWKDFQGKTGKGTAVPFTGDTGTFWFFDPANVELAVKVLDGRPLNGKFWVFYGALSNVEYTVRVTDSETGSVKEYKNPSGRFGSVGDTGAF